MKVIGYLRVSTKGQVGEDKFGLESQRSAIEEYCNEKGYEIADFYVDAGVSGAKEERPQFGRILSGDIPEGVEAVVVAKSDRIARDIYIYFAYKNELRKMGIQVISVAEDFGEQGVFAVVLDAMVAAMAEVERQNIKTRLTGGRNQKAKKGGYSGGKVPYGYKASGKTLVIEPSEAEIVKGIYKLRSRGYSMQDICDRINASGRRNRSGRVFHASSIKSILDNKLTYEGMYKYGDNEWVKGEHQAII